MVVFAEVGHRRIQRPHRTKDSEAFQLKEVELPFKLLVDPIREPTLIVSITRGSAPSGGGKPSIGFRFPGGLALKAGKISKPTFGRFSTGIHPAETALADRPTVEQKYFGEEGLSGCGGGSLSWQVPNPASVDQCDLEAVTAPNRHGPLRLSNKGQKKRPSSM